MRNILTVYVSTEIYMNNKTLNFLLWRKPICYVVCGVAKFSFPLAMKLFADFMKN